MSTKSVLVFLAAGVTFFLLDQRTKGIALKRAANRPIRWGRLLQIKSVAHREASYSRGSARTWLGLSWFAALAGAILLVGSDVWFRTPVARLGLAVALGGAAGNLVDIRRRGHIVNFIDLGWWPVFNLADAGIVVGLLMAFWPGI